MEENAHLRLINSCNENDLLNYSRKVKRYEDTQENMMNNRHFKKLRFWGKNKKKSFITQEPIDVPYLNFSKRVFNKHQDALLKLGPKYVMENNINIKDSIPRIEGVIRNLPITERNGFRSEIQKRIKKMLKNPLTNQEDRKTLKEIKQDKSIVCLKTDKTGKIAILDRCDYNRKMEETIEEIQATEYINKKKPNPNKNIQDKITELKKNGSWPDDKKPHIINHAPNIPRLFGSLKDHKPDKKLRPIVNRRDGPTYYLERYVDDVLVILDKVNTGNVLNYINNIDSNIQFTCEKEGITGINYLDICIIRDENEKRGFHTKIHRKEGKSEEIINRNCKLPYTYKTAAIRSFINRAITVCSNKLYLEEELEKIKDIVSKAGFKRSIVDSIYKNRIETLNTINSAQKPQRKITPSVNFDRGVGLFIAKKGREKNLTVPIKPSPNIFQLVRSEKDTLKDTEQPGIYRIEYEHEEKNEKGYYIGQTMRKIGDRVKEHEKDCFNLMDRTALAKLKKRENINILFQDVKKIANYENTSQAKCREAIEIITEERACNHMEHAYIDNSWGKFWRKTHAPEIDNTAPLVEDEF